MAAKSILYGCLLASLSTAVTSKPIGVTLLGSRNLTSESQKLADPNYGPVPGEDPVYSSYYGVAPPFPGYLRDAVLPTEKGPPAADDHVWQNLLSAELTAIAETEARHETWALLDIWGASPFAGPADTSFPYANPILDTTRPFVVAGSSCPAANPPVPATAAEPAGAERRAGDGVAGAGGRGSASRSRTRATSRGFRVGPSGAAPAATTPSIFRGVANVSVAIDASRWAPAGWERDRVVVVDDPGGDPGAASRPTGASSSPVVADAPGAPTEESVVAGPGIMLEQPAELGAKLI